MYIYIYICLVVEVFAMYVSTHLQIQAHILSTFFRKQLQNQGHILTERIRIGRFCLYYGHIPKYTCWIKSGYTSERKMTRVLKLDVPHIWLPAIGFTQNAFFGYPICYRSRFRTLHVSQCQARDSEHILILQIQFTTYPG